MADDDDDDPPIEAPRRDPDDVDDDAEVDDPEFEEEEHEEALQLLAEAWGVQVDDPPLLPVAVRAVVESRLLEDPRFLTRHDRIGWTALHHAVRSLRPKGDVLAYLVQKCPASIRIQSRDGHRALPLHLYLSGKSYGRTLEVTRVLVDAYPEALMEPAEDGSLPLHLALQIHTYVEPLPRAVVPFLVRSQPAALGVQDKAGRLPIHCLWLCEGADVTLSKVRDLVERFPASLLAKDGDGLLPIHRAVTCRKHRPLCDRAIVHSLAATCPESVNVRMPDGITLLHFVLRSSKERWGVETTRYLADVTPHALHTQDSRGDRAIHHAVRSGNLDFVRFLVRRDVDSVRAKGAIGRLPVHVAADFQKLEAVRFLFNFWPDLVHQLDDGGRNALHMAVSDPIRLGGETLKKVEFLLTLAPAMVGAADSEGRLPLHAAVDHESMLTYTEKTDELVSVVRLLIERHPGALQQPDSNGNLPLHVASQRYAPIPILRLLIEHFAEALQVRNHQGLLPVHLALHRERSETLQEQFELCLSVRDCYVQHEVVSVLFLVEQGPESIQELDARGRSLVHHALDGPETPGRRVALPLLRKWPDAVLVRDHCRIRFRITIGFVCPSYGF
jgi:ankyrin repeat protein